MANVVRILSGHNASYADPIVVADGQELRLTGRTDEWDGYRWLWAVALDGREGWVPDDLPRLNGHRYVATRDYSAVELSCKRGEVLKLVETSHGWAWCRNEFGREGWVPLRDVALLAP